MSDLTLFFKRKIDGHVYGVTCDLSSKEAIISKHVNSEWEFWKCCEIISVTEFQFSLLNFMINLESDTYNNKSWGFCAIGHRELARLMKLSVISTSNAMRSLMNKGVFFNAAVKDQWDDTMYFLSNPYMSNEHGGVFKLKSNKILKHVKKDNNK